MGIWIDASIMIFVALFSNRHQQFVLVSLSIHMRAKDIFFVWMQRWLVGKLGVGIKLGLLGSSDNRRFLNLPQFGHTGGFGDKKCVNATRDNQ